MNPGDRTEPEAMKESPLGLLPLDLLASRVEELRRSGERIVFTNGCFDLLHVGHLRYLTEAAGLGTRLVIGLNSDRSVSTLKGADRPLVPEDERAELLLALRPVDGVVIFDEDTPIEVIRRLRPDVLVKGGDYDPEATDGAEYIVGSDVVRSYGGEVRTIPLVPDRSTSRLARLLAGDRR